MPDILLAYFQKSTAITIIVLGWLSLYFIITFTILISRMIGLSAWQRKEEKAVESLLMGAKSSNVDSVLRKCAFGSMCKEKINVCISRAEREATSGLTWLSIIASTSPFIGLFGTVVSILDTFSKLGESSSIAVIAPAISEALVATGVGIFVAIPAYTFSLILKRKAFELMSVIRQSADVLLLNSSGAKEYNV